MPSKDKTILEGKVAEETLGVLLWPHEEGSLRILKTLAALAEKYVVATRAAVDCRKSVSKITSYSPALQNHQ
jgi:hypothetical protein